MASAAKAWEWWEGLGKPRYVLAPMVDNSDLPFRLLCRRYGAALCYTQMFNANSFSTSEVVRQQMFDPGPGDSDRPLIAQLAGCDAGKLIASANHLEGHVDAVDLNFGCPQRIASRGRYGSYLLEEDEDWLVGLVGEVVRGVSMPLTVKIRIVPDMYGEPSVRKTVRLCRRLEGVGVALITVHGRTRHMKNDQTGAADWSAIRAVKEAVAVPVIANGSVYSLAEAEACLEATGADAVMCAEGLLEDPALFSGKEVSREAIAVEYLKLAREFPPARMHPVRSHLFKLLYADVRLNLEAAERLHHGHTLDEIESIANLLIAQRQERRAGVANAQDPPNESWYHRHRARAADRLDEAKAAREQRTQNGDASDARDRVQGSGEDEPEAACLEAWAEELGSSGTVF